MYNYKNLCPFKWFILENFPFIEADFDAITNWQLMCKLGEEINKVIEKVNLTGKQVEDLTNAFNDLQNYINNYFENLDVQEEINNKLDDMAQNGELAEIIAQYLSTQAIIGFDTNSSLASAENLSNGNFARTFGKDTYNDGKGAFYKIRTVLNTDVPDGDNIITLTNTNNLVAEKMPNYYINEINNKIDNINDTIQNLNFGNPIYSFAWRGLSTEAPENSLPAIIKAGKNECYGVELDIQTTVDNEIVLMHDLTVDRMTDGTGTVNELTYAYISALTIDAGSYHEYYSGNLAKVPRLADVLYLIRMYNLHVMLELKGTWSDSNLENLLNVLKQNNLLKYTIIQAYNYEYLYKIRQLDKNIKVCFIVEQTPTSGNIQFILDMKPSMFNIAFQNNDYVLPTETKNILINNNIEFGFSFANDNVDVRKYCLNNHGITYLISKYGIPRTKSQIIKNIEAYIKSDGTIVPRFMGETQDNKNTLASSGFTCEIGSNNVYKLTYSTPLFNRYAEVNGNVIAGNILAPSNIPSGIKYTIVCSGQGEDGFSFRIIDIENSQIVTAQTVYNDIGNVRIQFLVAGEMI